MSAAERSQGTAFARTALAGNPSDGYGGAVLALTLPRWQARAHACSAAEPSVEPANALVQATVERFARELDGRASNSAVHWSTAIPQRVGLGSSSALVIAVARALCRLHHVQLDPAQLAEFALAVETEDLGIAAGLQDRVAQAYEGLTFMDFTTPPRYERLDRAHLAPLIVAWQTVAAADSGDVHGELRERARRGDPAVHEAMRELAASARGARDALLRRDHAGFGESVDRTFDLRRRLMPLDPLCVEMVQAARRAGASANFTGSGGAIVAVCSEARRLNEVETALRQIGCEVASI